jgi:hypothetical protein
MRAWRVFVVGVSVAVVAAMVAPVAGAASTSGTSDKQIATAGILVSSDFPATYTQAPRDASSDAKTLKRAAKLPSCKKLVAFMTVVKDNTEVKSDEFNQGQTQIDNTVTVFPTEAKAKAAVDAYSATGLPACLGQLVGKIAQQNGGKAKADIKKRNDVSAGDQSVAYEGPVAVTESNGSTATLGFGNLAIRIGRAVAVYSYNHDANTDISADLKSAIENSGGRLQAAVAG